ncbi:MAG TPA: DUF5668 domain-containing protein [Burkholderiaceae bacterium]|jgi:hypothetical protein
MDQLMENKRHARKRILWGLIMIAAGCLFLLERMDILEISGLWHFWPLIVAVIGAVEVLSATRARHVIRGLNQVMIGMWLFACMENLWGFNFGNSWPVLLIGCGVTIAAEGLVAGIKKTDKESLQ